LYVSNIIAKPLQHSPKWEGESRMLPDFVFLTEGPRGGGCKSRSRGRPPKIKLTDCLRMQMERESCVLGP